jgi:hypothetical protein
VDLKLVPYALFDRLGQGDLWRSNQVVLWLACWETTKRAKHGRVSRGEQAAHRNGRYPKAATTETLVFGSRTVNSTSVLEDKFQGSWRPTGGPISSQKPVLWPSGRPLRQL